MSKNNREPKGTSGARKRGGKLKRSEIVTIRLDPKLRHLTELAARNERRTLSSFIERAVAEALTRVVLTNAGGVTTTIADAAEGLWDVDEADRFVRLAFQFPALLTHDEQVLWKLIRENGAVWRGRYDDDGRWVWYPGEDEIDWERLRATWPIFVAVAAGKADRSALPDWLRERPPVDFHRGGES